MPLTMLALPLEILHYICNCLTDHADVSNFRLACRTLSTVGLDNLAPTVSFAILPESLDRLKAIAAHPVLRHHVYTVICLTDVLPYYESFESWKNHAQDPDIHLGWVVQADDEWARESDILAQARHQIPDAKLQKGWQAYSSNLAAQGKAFQSLDDSQELIDVFKGLTHLKNLEIKGSESDGESLSTQILKKLFDSCLVRPSPTLARPFFPFGSNGYFGSHTAKLLTSLFAAASAVHKDIISLRVDTLDCCFFGDGGPKLEYFTQVLSKLRHLKLDLVVEAVEDNFTSWEKAKMALSSDHLQNFLCSALELEDLDIQFASDTDEPFIGNTAKTFPTESIWRSLRSLDLAGISFTPSSFLGFLGCHSKTLRHLYLADCDLAVAQEPNLLVIAPTGADQSSPSLLWSDFFIPLSGMFSLASFYISGLLTVNRRLDDESLDYIRPDDGVQNIGLTVGKVLEILICSESFNAFLRRKVEGSQDIDADTIKAYMIQDLVDNVPMFQYGTRVT
ncbi:unnamed protein product [Clonostachys chloroleuca]|uniref:F-box domain-containing protein n=1 Tax=Clonostachys chloroleuca TaxID=1926264 RepID=A0AA35Q5M6_9HYPO|nr:unnamed protein product [Clonostachys chloroleuca]